MPVPAAYSQINGVSGDLGRASVNCTETQRYRQPVSSGARSLWWAWRASMTARITVRVHVMRFHLALEFGDSTSGVINIAGANWRCR